MILTSVYGRKVKKLSVRIDHGQSTAKSAIRGQPHARELKKTTYRAQLRVCSGDHHPWSPSVPLG